MKVIKFDEKQLRELIKQDNPEYIFMNGNTLAFISQSLGDPFINMDAYGYSGCFQGVKVISTTAIPFGEVIFGVE
jgi:hypothetical protein